MQMNANVKEHKHGHINRDTQTHPKPNSTNRPIYHGPERRLELLPGLIIKDSSNQI